MSHDFEIHRTIANQRSLGFNDIQAERNVFHHRELDAAELADLVAPHVDALQVTGLGHADRLQAWEREHGSLVQALVHAPPPQWEPGLVEVVTSVTADDFAAAEVTDEALDLVVVAVAR